MASLEITVNVADTELFQDIMRYIADVDKNNPEIGIQKTIDAICEAHKMPE